MCSLPSNIRYFTPQFHLLGCLLVLFIISDCAAYNFESQLPLFKYGPENGTFGFSVAQHRFAADDTTGLRDTLLVIGSPTAEALPSQPGTTKPGGVFYCPVSTDPDDCRRVMMDSGGDSTANGIKSNEWLGVSVKSQGPGKMLISCAHRWAQHLYSGPGEVERVCGKCFLLKATSRNRIDEVSPDDPTLSPGFESSPCNKFDDDKLDSKRRYGYMQAGTSVYIHNDHYLLGAPGAWAWTGTVFDFNMPAATSSVFGQEQATMYSTPTCFESEISGPGNSKCDKLPVRRDSYMGFAVATSSAIVEDSDETFYVAGAPRGNNTGAVIFFRKNTGSGGDTALEHVPFQSIVGERIASSFGFSVALTDINGDGLDDLIVGAPQYYQYTKEGKLGGAVYVYQNVPGRGFSEVGPQRLFGPLDSFFGYSVASLGDIDQDGFNDFAVGAPYEDGNGVVHIFRGSETGTVHESQVLKGMDYPHVSASGKGDIEGFGASLSGVIDADSNKYPDLLVGTLSDHASLFRTRPIISVTMTLDVRPIEIDLDQKNCTSGGEPYACFKVRYCFTYKGRHNEYRQNLELKYKLTLDSIRKSEKKSSRVHFESHDGESVVEKKVVIPKAGRTLCPGKFHDIYFSKNVEDKLSDIGIDFEFDLDGDTVEREEIGEPVYDMINDPILDVDLDRQKKKAIKIKNNCGRDGCQSNLAVDASMPEEVIVGDDKDVTLTIEVSNDGEEAHQAYAIVNIPADVEYNGFVVTEPSGTEVQCYSVSSGVSPFIRCDLGNPYESGSRDVIEIQLGVSRLTAKVKSLDVKVIAYTTSDNPEIFPVALQAQVIIELHLSLTANAQPEQVRYTEKEIVGESAMVNTDNIGPLAVYTFNVKNEALQPAAGVELHVKLPYEIRNGKWLLYLVTSDVRSGGPQPTGTCGSSNVNILQLEPSLPVRRTKRSPQESNIRPVAQPSTSGGSPYSVITLSCGRRNAQCIDIICSVDEIMPGATTSIVLQSHVWEATFLEEFRETDLVHIQTTANISTSEENVRFKGDKTSGTVQTTVDHEFFKSDVTSTFPWWYILIGVIILLLIYVLIIFLLIKCGFFKRKKYRNEQDEDDAVLVAYEEADKEKRTDESNM